MLKSDYWKVFVRYCFYSSSFSGSLSCSPDEHIVMRIERCDLYGTGCECEFPLGCGGEEEHGGGVRGIGPLPGCRLYHLCEKGEPRKAHPF